MKHAAVAVLVGIVVVAALAFLPEYGPALRKGGLGGIVAQAQGRAAESPEPVTASMSVGMDGAVSIDGERVQDPVSTKTQVYDGAQTVSGVITIKNQSYLGAESQAPTKEVLLTGQLQIMDITIEDWDTFGPEGTPLDPYPDPPGNNVLVFMYTLFGETEGAPMQRRYIYFNADTPEPWNISLPFSISTGAQRVLRSQTTSVGTGRDAGPVYAKEVAAADEWVEVDHPWSFNMSFGDLASAGEQWFWEGSWQPGLAVLNQFDMHISQAAGLIGTEYITLELQWSEADVSFSGMSKTVSTMGFVGSGNQVSVSCLASFQLPPAQWIRHTVGVRVPSIYDFTKFRLPNRSDEDDAGLRISGGFTASKHYPASLAWSDTP